MREIKFRVFDKYGNRMITNDVDSYASFLANGEVNHGGLFGTTVLMQYTGRKDKNGVDIYEGDIYKWLGDDEYQVVEYDSYTSGWNWPYYEDTTETFEVVGNIYENPELLK